MSLERTFNVVVVSKEKPGKIDFDAAPDKVMKYSGDEISVKL
jgi:hypothetical protein